MISIFLSWKMELKKERKSDLLVNSDLNFQVNFKKVKFQIKLFSGFNNMLMSDITHTVNEFDFHFSVGYFKERKSPEIH